jgi:hypothetical protein
MQHMISKMEHVISLHKARSLINDKDKSKHRK